VSAIEALRGSEVVIVADMYLRPGITKPISGFLLALTVSGDDPILEQQSAGPCGGGGGKKDGAAGDDPQTWTATVLSLGPGINTAQNLTGPGANLATVHGCNRFEVALPGVTTGAPPVPSLAEDRDEPVRSRLIRVRFAGSVRRSARDGARATVTVAAVGSPELRNSTVNPIAAQVTVIAVTAHLNLALHLDPSSPHGPSQRGFAENGGDVPVELVVTGRAWNVTLNIGAPVFADRGDLLGNTDPEAQLARIAMRLAEARRTLAGNPVDHSGFPVVCEVVNNTMSVSQRTPSPQRNPYRQFE
jgi:hypothetical protein